MSDIYRIYEPDAADPEDVSGYLIIDCFGRYSQVQKLDADFHIIDDHRVNMDRRDPGYHEACGMDREHGYVIMYDMDFYRKQRAAKQREYRARRKAREQEVTPVDLTTLVARMQQILLFPGAQATAPEDFYQISAVAEKEGEEELSAYVRMQGDRMKAQELSPRDAVRNVSLAGRAELEGGEREKARMVAEAEQSYDPENQQESTTERIER